MRLPSPDWNTARRIELRIEINKENRKVYCTLVVVGGIVGAQCARHTSPRGWSTGSYCSGGLRVMRGHTAPRGGPLYLGGGWGWWEGTLPHEGVHYTLVVVEDDERAHCPTRGFTIPWWWLGMMRGHTAPRGGPLYLGGGWGWWEGTLPQDGGPLGCCSSICMSWVKNNIYYHSRYSGDIPII